MNQPALNIATKAPFAKRTDNFIGGDCFKFMAVMGSSSPRVKGVADDMRGESVKAFVVLKEGFNIGPLEIKYFAREHLANFKVPQSVEIRMALPKNRVGKIDKELLKQEVLA